MKTKAKIYNEENGIFRTLSELPPPKKGVWACF